MLVHCHRYKHLILIRLSRYRPEQNKQHSVVICTNDIPIDVNSNTVPHDIMGIMHMATVNIGSGFPLFEQGFSMVNYVQFHLVVYFTNVDFLGRLIQYLDNTINMIN